MSRSGTGPTAVLWDLDGTIADTHPLIHRCVDETFRHYFGRPYEQRLWERSVGHPLTVVIEEGFREYGLACDDTAGLVRFYRERLKGYESLVIPFSGSLETIGRLAERGYRQGVVTTKFAEAAARHLETLGLTDAFEVVVTGDHCSRHKPHPEPFHRAVEALELPSAQCVMVGDSAADVKGAKAAGLFAIAAAWGSLDPDAVQEAEPHFTARRPGDIETILEEWPF